MGEICRTFVLHCEIINGFLFKFMAFSSWQLKIKSVPLSYVPNVHKTLLKNFHNFLPAESRSQSLHYRWLTEFFCECIVQLINSVKSFYDHFLSPSPHTNPSQVADAGMSERQSCTSKQLSLHAVKGQSMQQQWVSPCSPGNGVPSVIYSLPIIVTDKAIKHELINSKYNRPSLSRDSKLRWVASEY